MLESIFLLGAFFLGSIPMGLVVAYFYGVDIRKSGSGNIGATNVIRCVSKKAGYLTFFLDMLKGVVPLVLASFFLADSPREDVFDVIPFIGLMAILGHCFSPFLGGKGGKGVATSFAVFLYLFPQGAVAGILIFAVVFFLSRYVSLSSLLAAITFVLMGVFWVEGNEMQIVVVVAFLVVLLKHKENIYRLFKGEENRFKDKDVKKCL